ncbi:MAG: alpha-L-fucosidase [Bacteroidetes bacterium]|nr:alpha-L-fucosidase [Bacteroidota bacterium]
MKRIILLFFFFVSIRVFSQENKMQWFADAKLGIFIHWGIYSVNGIDESWSFYNKKISHADYMKQLSGFTASEYKPHAWVELIKRSGARYAVITAKHHDGVALWNTQMNELSVPKKTPAASDVLSPFVHALREYDIKVGTYFSLIDWSYSDYTGFLKDSSRYDSKKDPERWKRFTGFCMGQISEISLQFNPDLFWFDGDWEHSAEEWLAPEIRKMILDHNPETIINGRLQGYGDYDTPEQNFPVTKPNLKYWELCMTINDNWGYQQRDTNYKTPYEIISIFADAISMGGNLLLDIGPKADGSIPKEQEYMLTELGQWTGKHSEAIFNTIAGLPHGHFYGPTTLSKDSLILYLFLPAKTSGDVVIKGLDTKIKRVSVVGSNEQLPVKIVGKISWSKVPGLVYIHVPEPSTDRYMTVLKVDLENPVRLYSGKGGFN